MNRLPILLCIVFLIGCKQTQNPDIDLIESGFKIAESMEMERTNNGIKIISGGQQTFFRNNQLPLKSTVCVSSSATAYLNILDLLDELKGVTNPKFIFNKRIIKLIENEKIKDIGSSNELDLETIFLLNPDVVISTSNPTLSKFHEQLIQNKIPVLYLDEYKEKHPLGKTELIKLFGILFGKEKQANHLFDEIQRNYNNLKNTSQLKTKNPTTMAGIMYGDIWYAPSGESFQAQYFKDAGANYIWKNKTESESIRMSFEEVFEKSNHVKIWLNAADFKSLNALRASYQNYEWLNPYKEKNVFSWSKRSNEFGANDYFETGIIRADWVLRDLIHILHTDSVMNEKLHFYQKLE